MVHEDLVGKDCIIKYEALVLEPEVGYQVRLRGIRRPHWLILVRDCFSILYLRQTNFLIWKVQADGVVVCSCVVIDIVLNSKAHALVFPTNLIVGACNEVVELFLGRKVLGFVCWKTKLEDRR